MLVSRPRQSGFLDGLDDIGVADAYAEEIEAILAKNVLSSKDARVLRRIGRFRMVRTAARDRSLYQDVETLNFWQLQDGAVVRVIAMDADGVVVKGASVRDAGGSTGYYRIRRMEQNPGTLNDGAGEKNSGKTADEEVEIEPESAIGMQPDRYYQDKPFNRGEGPGHAYTAANAKPLKKGDWVTDGDGNEFQVDADQTLDGRIVVKDAVGKVKDHPVPQSLQLKTQPGSDQPTTARKNVAGMRENQVAGLIDFTFEGLPDRKSDDAEPVGLGVPRGDELGFLGELDVADVVPATHADEIARIMASGAIDFRTARTLRRAGRLEIVSQGLYRDAVSGDLWAVDGDTVRRGEILRTAASKSKGFARLAAWDTIDSVLGLTDGWVPKFRASENPQAVGIHLKNPTADDVVSAIQAAREQGYTTVHVH